MNRLFRLAVRIYPREWRERYGAEFVALLEQLPGGPGDLVDITLQAIKMRLQPGNIPDLVAYGVLAVILVWGSAQTTGSHAAARLSEAVFTVLGIPVLRDGNLLSLARHQLSVGFFSNGVWALMALALLATGHVVLVRMRLASRVLFLLGLIPITIIACSIRIVITGVLAEAYDEGVLVTVFGWLGFLVCTTTLLVLGQYFAGAIRWRPGRER